MRASKARARAQTQKSLDRSAKAGAKHVARYKNVNHGSAMTKVEGWLINKVNKTFGTNRESPAEHSKQAQMKGDVVRANRARKKVGPSSKPNTPKSNAVSQMRSAHKGRDY
ncbi:MAG TPA: hypothetical protein VM537_20395 [Anaerolineae bacterium]|nr:hypothetical protein [Anaerolineae bacterium]